MPAINYAVASISRVSDVCVEGEKMDDARYEAFMGPVLARIV